MCQDHPLNAHPCRHYAGHRPPSPILFGQGNLVKPRPPTIMRNVVPFLVAHIGDSAAHHSVRIVLFGTDRLVRVDTTTVVRRQSR